MNKKNKCLIYATSILFLSGFISGGMPIFSNIFIFSGENNPKLSAAIEINSPVEGKTYTPHMEGYYPASFGFESDEDGSEPGNWTVYEAAGSIQVLSELDGHKKVVEITDNHGTYRSYAYQTFDTAQSSGEIEFWWRLESGNNHNFRVRSGVASGSSEAIQVRARDSTMEYQYYDGSSWHAICNYQDLTWHHVRIKFNLSQGWDLWLDDDLESNGNYEFSFANSLAFVDNLQFDTGTGIEKDQWFDAVGYDWDPNYDIGDNKPIMGYYPAVYGFENDDDGEDPFGWIVDENGGPIQVLSELDDHKKVVEIADNHGTYRSYAYQTFSSPQSMGEIEFWWRLESGNHHNVRVRSGTTTGTSEVIQIRARKTTMEYQYYDGSAWNPICNYQDLTWHHVRIKFNLSQGWDLWLDGEPKSQGNYEFSFANNLTTVDNLQFDTGTGMEKDQWFDAVGYTWNLDSGYIIGDNRHEGLLLDFEPDNLAEIEYTLTSTSGSIGPFSIFGDTVIPIPESENYTLYLTGNDSGENYSAEIEFIIRSINISTPIDGEHYKEPMNGYFPATYGFENDDGGDDPFDWIIDENGGPIQVISDLDGHKKVVEIQDNDGINRSYAYQNFSSPQSSGEIEFWWRLESGNHHNVRVRSGTLSDTSEVIQVRARKTTMEYQYYDGSSWHAICNYQDLTWHHVRIKFNLSQGWDLWLDDDLESNGNYEFSFANNFTTVDNLQFDTGTGIEKDQWFDAIGYSWDSEYKLGDNRHEGLLLNLDLDIDNDDLDDLEWIALSYDNEPLSTIYGDKVISYDWGTHSIQLIGKDLSGAYYCSKVCSYTCMNFATGFLYTQSSESHSWDGGTWIDEDCAITSVEKPGDYLVIYTATYEHTTNFLGIKGLGGWVKLVVDDIVIEKTKRLYESLGVGGNLYDIYGTLIVADVVTLDYEGVKAQIYFNGALFHEMTLLNRSMCAIPLLGDYKYVSNETYSQFYPLGRTIINEDPNIYFENITGEYYAIYTASFKINDPTWDILGVHGNGFARFSIEDSAESYTQRDFEFPALTGCSQMTGTIILADVLELDNQDLQVQLNYWARDRVYNVEEQRYEMENGDESMTIMERSLILIPLVNDFKYEKRTYNPEDYNQDIVFEDINFKCFVMYTARYRIVDLDGDYDDNAIGWGWTAYNNGIDIIDYTSRYYEYPHGYGSSFRKTVYLVEILDFSKEDIKVEYYWEPNDNEELRLNQRSMILIPFL